MQALGRKWVRGTYVGQGARLNAAEETSRTSSRIGRPPRGTEADATVRILAAARPIFLSEGYEAASVDAIANAAGVSKKTIYVRFASKEDLFEAVILRLIEENIPMIERAAAEEGPVAERLHRIALAVLEVALSPDCIASRRIIVAEAVRFPAFARVLHDLGMARVHPLVERCLEDGRRSGEIAVSDVRLLTDIFIGVAVRGFVEKAELGLERPGLTHVKRETLRHAIDFFMSACRRDPGAAEIAAP